MIPSRVQGDNGARTETFLNAVKMPHRAEISRGDES